jgi:hypothetical protein
MSKIKYIEMRDIDFIHFKKLNADEIRKEFRARIGDVECIKIEHEEQERIFRFYYKGGRELEQNHRIEVLNDTKKAEK